MFPPSPSSSSSSSSTSSSSSSSSTASITSSTTEVDNKQKGGLHPDKKPELYKTEMCRNWVEMGYCR